LYGCPESHAASFALLVYASAYLKVHYPAAFFTAMLNNQPMGFYHPATLVKDAQRRGVRFAPIDVQVSDWECRVEPDGRVRLGLMYVNGLRQAVGRAIAAGSANHATKEAPADLTELDPRSPEMPPARWLTGGSHSTIPRCPKCGCDDESMLEETPEQTWFCNICAHEWGRPPARVDAEGRSVLHRGDGPRYRSFEELIAATGVRRDELATLAEIGALNTIPDPSEASGHHRRSALWQIERAVRPSGELFKEEDSALGIPASGSVQSAATLTHSTSDRRPTTAERRRPAAGEGPLQPMTPPERLLADYAGMSLTIGPHPMALRRAELALRGVLRARDLPGGRHGRRVRVAGAVITRQRPGTAKGFVFLTLEDETGIANIIVRPDLFTEQRSAIVGAPYLLIEGTLQLQEGVTSIKAERVIPLTGDSPQPQSHDFR
jgi:error-prone DNA polymerase